MSEQYYAPDYAGFVISHVREIEDGIPDFEEHCANEIGGMLDNVDRADIGRVILDTARSQMGHPDDDACEELVADSICNMLHAAHEEGSDILAILSSALGNFIAETKGED